MSTLDKFTQKAAKEFVVEGQAFDPAIIYVFADIIIQVINVLKECKQQPKDAAAMANNPSFWQKIALRREVRRVMGDRREFRQHGDRVVEALLKTGRSVTTEEAAQLYEEVD